jgi:hypothetical protein
MCIKPLEGLLACKQMELGCPLLELQKVILDTKLSLIPSSLKQGCG